MVQSHSSVSDTVVEYGVDVELHVALAMVHLSERDAASVLYLKQYHEALYLYGFDIPKVNITRMA
jgi:hypothetical protein